MKPQVNKLATWSVDEQALEQMRDFNRKLARLPRFRIRNRVIPRVIQALLRVGQIAGGLKLRKHGLVAETSRRH
ncbi:MULTISPECIES: hypothetical protein [unclassified Pseudomonas]|uniref:hypothetical protein n=1 Tax=unclassified Pseudomonas TaxID=196821 RepID=UPI000A1F614E|nr:MULTISPECIES: hypothetical protein [unclassified Pseudomonas]